MTTATVNDMVAVDDTGADDYGLTVGRTVEVVGFYSDNGALYAVVVTDHFRSLPAWYLTPASEQAAVPA